MAFGPGPVRAGSGVMMLSGMERKEERRGGPGLGGGPAVGIGVAGWMPRPDPVSGAA